MGGCSSQSGKVLPEPRLTTHSEPTSFTGPEGMLFQVWGEYKGRMFAYAGIVGKDGVILGPQKREWRLLRVEVRDPGMSWSFSPIPNLD